MNQSEFLSIFSELYAKLVNDVSDKVQQQQKESISALVAERILFWIDAYLSDHIEKWVEEHLDIENSIESWMENNFDIESHVVECVRNLDTDVFNDVVVECIQNSVTFDVDITVR